MKQRVAIAKALALKPQIILMDEPFASLDAMTRNHLQEELMKLHQKEKVTVIFITHNIQEQSAWEQGSWSWQSRAVSRWMCQIRFRNQSHRHRKAMDRCGICLTKHCIRKVNKGKIMSYTSSTYLLFLVAVFCIYYIIRPRHRMYVLLVANVIFYLAAGFDQFLVLLLATAVSYVVACKMGEIA